ncbi:MAG: APH(6) family putative aminoglycoside O-phosphotransferase [Azospirillum brasilense]|nr:MAG: APH(6) family putative aminoglycoside O-phosphotransferase [Azospirillum brasilense]
MPPAVTLVDFAAHLRDWDLRPDGAPFATHAARLLPVRWRGVPAILKLSDDEDERRGARLLRWWDGDGAARVLAGDGRALLLERATGAGDLSAMARGGLDDEACRILCAVAARLHGPRRGPEPSLVPLSHWFQELRPVAAAQGGILRHCAAAARHLLDSPRDIRVLHGDLHHGNVLDFGSQGWLAIDPKGLLGERGFDFANIFTNPDLADASHPVATAPDRFARRLVVVAETAGLERRRLLLWILAWAGLSAVWFLQDGQEARIDFRIAEQAIAALEMGRGREDGLPGP